MNDEVFAGVEPGLDGEPVLRFVPVEMADLSRSDLPPYCMPIDRDRPTVEVAPGVLVSQHLIDDAVSRTTAAEGPQAHHDYYKRGQERVHQHFQEVKQDLEASKKFVQEMFMRVSNPPNMKEKYISFDALPAPLQRVVSAYTAAAEANKELEEALAALKQPEPVA